MRELKSCPFCASSEVMIEEYEDQMSVSNNYVMCLDCGSSGPSCTNETQAQITWNHREGAL